MKRFLLNLTLFSMSVIIAAAALVGCGDTPTEPNVPKDSNPIHFDTMARFDPYLSQVEAPPSGTIEFWSAGKHFMHRAGKVSIIGDSVLRIMDARNGTVSIDVKDIRVGTTNRVKGKFSYFDAWDDKKWMSGGGRLSITRFDPATGMISGKFAFEIWPIGQYSWSEPTLVYGAFNELTSAEPRKVVPTATAFIEDIEQGITYELSPAPTFQCTNGGISAPNSFTFLLQGRSPFRMQQVVDHKLIIHVQTEPPLRSRIIPLYAEYSNGSTDQFEFHSTNSKNSLEITAKDSANWTISGTYSLVFVSSQIKRGVRIYGTFTDAVMFWE